MITTTILNSQLVNVKRITEGKVKTFITLNNFNANETALTTLEKKATTVQSFYTSEYCFLILEIDKHIYSIKAKK